jgi:hypothetical protein
MIEMYAMAWQSHEFIFSRDRTKIIKCYNKIVGTSFQNSNWLDIVLNIIE